MAQGISSKKIFVNEIKDGERIKSIFLVKFKATPVKKNGEPYINMIIADRTGDIEAKVWDNARELEKRFQKNDFISVDGLANIYQGRLQLRIEELIKIAESDVNIADFLPIAGSDIETMWSELCSILKGVENTQLVSLINEYLSDGDLVSAIKTAPAAKEIHHAFIGGLLEHTLSMVKCAQALCPLYPLADRDIVITGCFLHDIGKTKELNFDKSFDYSDEGRLIGHIVFGVELLGNKMRNIDKFPEQLALHLKHIILSHHGELQFGSPKRPKTIEALLVSLIDDLDAKMNSWKLIFEKNPGESWTSFQKIYERYLFKGKPDSGQKISGAKGTMAASNSNNGDPETSAVNKTSNLSRAGSDVLQAIHSRGCL